MGRLEEIAGRGKAAVLTMEMQRGVVGDLAVIRALADVVASDGIPKRLGALVDAGADGVVVSNHGGRQLDGVSSTIAALPPVADALKGRTKILVDGGVRSGQDILRAVASGADAALIGRPWVYAVAAEGEAGLKRYLGLMAHDLRVAMALTGVTTISAIDASILDRP